MYKIRERRMKFIYAAAMMVLLIVPASAQTMSPVPRYGEEDKPKTPADIEAERRDGAAYKRSLGSIPDSRPVDPWGSVRSEPAPKPAAAKKKPAPAN